MEDIVKEYRSKNNTGIQDFFANLVFGQVAIIGIIFLIIIAITKNGQIDQRYNYVGWGVLIVIILVLYFRPSKEKKLLSREIVIKIAQEEVNRMINEGREFSYDSKVDIGPACHLEKENLLLTGSSNPVSWDVGFAERVHGSQYKKEGVISIHPYDGTIIGLEWRPLGYTGRETRDKDVVPVEVLKDK